MAKLHWWEGAKMVLMIIAVILFVGLIDDFGRVLGALSRSYPLLFVSTVFGPIWTALILKALRSSASEVLGWCKEWRQENVASLQTLILFYVTLAGPLTAAPVPGLTAMQAYFTLAEHPQLARKLGAGEQDASAAAWEHEQVVAVLLLVVMCTGCNVLWKEASLLRAGDGAQPEKRG